MALAHLIEHNHDHCFLCGIDGGVDMEVHFHSFHPAHCIGWFSREVSKKCCFKFSDMGGHWGCYWWYCGHLWGCWGEHLLSVWSGILEGSAGVATMIWGGMEATVEVEGSVEGKNGLSSSLESSKSLKAWDLLGEDMLVGESCS